MKYLIDLTSLSEKNTGIEYVAENAAISVISNFENSEFILVFNKFISKVFNNYSKKSNIKIVNLNTDNWYLLRFIKLPGIIRKMKADYNLFFAFPCPYFAPHKNAITLIHDLTPFKYPKTQTLIQNFHWKRMLKKCIKKDKYILSVTDTIKYEIANKFSRGDVKRIYPGVKEPSENSRENFYLESFGNYLEEFLLEKGKYLTVCSSNLLVNSGYQKRVFQYWEGLEHFHVVDKYTGNSDFIIDSWFDLFRAFFRKQVCFYRSDYISLVHLLKTGMYDVVFFDNSCFGNVYKKLQTKFPNIKIITHFHNCECKFYKDFCEFNRINFINIKSKATLWMLNISENLARQFSDYLIFISEKDKEDVFCGYNRTDNKVIPPCLPDEYTKVYEDNFNTEYVMFVGSYFYANIEAIDFLVNKVAPYVNKKIVIVGDDLSKKYNNSKNVIFVNYRDNIKEIFTNSLAFVAPIFSGSGAKIKIAEALMWGKKIIATKDAVVGYDVNNMDVNLCTNAKDFINAINNCVVSEKFSEINRNLYLNNYSLDANNRYFSNI